MKIRASLLALLLLTAALSAVEARSGDFGNVLSLTAAGYDPVGRFENSTARSSGVSLCQEFFIDAGDSFQAGIGFKYLFPREYSDGESLSWQPLYGSIKAFIPATELPVYIKASAGYAFVRGNSSFDDKYTDTAGGFYYFLGGGVDLPFYYSRSVRFSFIFDMGYSSYGGRAERGSSEISLSYVTLDMTVGIGLKF